MQTYDKFYVGGAWVAPSGNDTIDVINGTTEEVMGRIPAGAAEDGAKAVEAARAAFESWSNTSKEERIGYLKKIQEGLVARADDIANWVPARIYAALLALAAPGSARRMLRVVRRDAPRHPSPNAGVAEAAMAASLGVELGGPVKYGEEHQDRPRLGDGPRPQPHDIRRALGLSRRTEDLLVLALVSTGLARPSRGTRGRAQPPS